MNKLGVKKRRKILMLIPELGYGGAEKSFLRLSHLLSEHHEVRIAVFKRHYAKGGYSTSADEALALPVVIMDDEEHSGRLRRWMNRWKKLRVLKRDSDITISFLTGANILNVIVFGKDKTVVSMRGSRHFDPAFTGAKRCVYEYIIDPKTFIMANRIVSISEGLSYELGTHVGINTKRKIQTIELFVDAEEMILRTSDPIEEKLEKLKGQPIIITAGRLSLEKGFQHLITVFSNVRESVPNAKLILIGDGPMHQTLIELCRTLDLPMSDGSSGVDEAAVIFLGYRKNPFRYFRIAKTFVLSSLTEGFSNTVLEALAAGVPVVATNCPWGPRSILWERPDDVESPYPTEEGIQADYGLLMPRIDIKHYHKEWIDVLTTTLLVPKTDNELIDHGRNRLREFDYHLIGQKWFKLVEELN